MLSVTWLFGFTITLEDAGKRIVHFLKIYIIIIKFYGWDFEGVLKWYAHEVSDNHVILQKIHRFKL